MPIYARRNLLISSFGPNVLLTQPLTNGQVLVYDAQLGSFINSPGSELFTATNLGTGQHVFHGKVGSDFQFDSLVAGANVQISETTPGNITISANVRGAGVVQVVADIATRDSLIPTLPDGALVFVQHDLDNEYSMYMWDLTLAQFRLLSTQDSADVDAKSLTYTITATSASEIVIGNVSPGTRVVEVSVRVIEAFDAPAEVTVGDDLDHARHITGDESDLELVEQFYSESAYVYGGVLDTDIKVFFSANGATQGVAQIVVSYV